GRELDLWSFGFCG
ncbi:hypothetical protein VCEDC022_003329B, partial [Vibrio cholerae O1 str. EDC-022]